MKHSHWSFKANTETFDGRRAVKEAYAAGMQIVTFETEEYYLTLATDELYNEWIDASLVVPVVETAPIGRAFVPAVDVDGIGPTLAEIDADLPPYVHQLDLSADEVREMVAKLKKPQRVAVSGYGPEAGVVTKTQVPYLPIKPRTDYKLRCGVVAHCSRTSSDLADITYTDAAGIEHNTDVYAKTGRAYSDPTKTSGLDIVGFADAEPVAAKPAPFKWEGPGETFTWSGCEYIDAVHPRDFVGGKVRDL